MRHGRSVSETLVSVLVLLVLVAGAFALRLAWETLPDAAKRGKKIKALRRPSRAAYKTRGRFRSQGRSSSRALRGTPNIRTATSSSPAARRTDPSR